MIDPGTIVGITSLGLQVCQGLLSYYKGFKGSGEDIVELCKSLEHSKKGLELLQNNLDKLQHDGSIATALKNEMQHCSEIYNTLQRILDKISEGKGKGGWRRPGKSLLSRVKYPFKQDLIMKLHWFLHEHEQHLNILLGTLQIESVSTLNNQLSSIGGKFDHVSLTVDGVHANVQEVKEHFQKFKRDEKDSNICDWLCSIDLSPNHDAAMIQMEPGTGKWFLEGPEFCTWKTSGSLMWLNGGIGRGKTVLCSAIIEDLKSVCAADESSKLAYFYFTFRDSAIQSTYGDPATHATFICLASILRQICPRTELPQELITLYDDGQRDSRRAPRLIDIQTLLPSLVRGIKKVFIVLDALDECPQYLRGLGRAEFLKWILELSNECPNVQILLTSRNNLSTVDIAEEVRSHSKLVEVSVDATKTRDDMLLYITKQFNSNPVLRKINEISNVDIPAVLQEKSDGMFQYISCQLDALKRLGTLRQNSIARILSTFPKTLDEAYMRILSSVDDEDAREVVTNALRWLAFALEPLTVEEINEACILNPNATTAISNDERLAPDDIQRLLQGLVMTRPLKRDIARDGRELTSDELAAGTITIRKEEHDELCLSHFSVKEFLTVDAKTGNHEYQFEENDSHAIMAMNCIAYIFYYSSSAEKTSTRQDLKSFVLLWYSCRFWFEHARLAGESGRHLTPYILQLIRSLPTWTDCLLVYDPYRPHSWPFTRRAISEFASALGWTAVLGLDLVAEFLLEDKTEDINACQDKAQSEFHGTGDSMEFWSDQVDGTALVKAVAFGHEKMVQTLLTKGATVDLAALDAACSYEQENILRILIDAGADSNSQQGEDEVLLDTAAWSENVKIINILLKKGADPNGLPEPAVSPLMRAAWFGNLDICKSLIDHKADINRSSGDPEYPDALASAASMGNLHVVQLFLEQNHINITNHALYYSLTGLEDGPIGDHKGICRLLIEKGVDLDPISGGFEKYHRPLAIALYNGWEDIVKLMIDKGAKIVPDDPSCVYSGNLLQSAVLSGKTELVRLLLDNYINVNAPCVDLENYSCHEIETIYATSLQAAVYNLDLDMTELLLKSKANPNSSGEPYHSPLGALAAGIMRYYYSPEEWLSKTEAAEATYLLLQERGADLKSAKSLCKEETHRWALQKLGKGKLRKEVQKYVLQFDAQ